MAPKPVRLDTTVGRHRLVASERPLVMGILNVTPDSFSDGGRFLDAEAATDRAFAMAVEGADLLDVGGESTRPGASPVSVEEEATRVLPVLARLEQAGFPLPVSVDTRRATVAAQAIERGAAMVNDVSAMADPAMGTIVAEAGVCVVLMHMKGDPATMQRLPSYENVVEEVRSFLASRREAAVAAGIAQERIVLDPGLGFGKRTGRGIEDNLRLLSELPRLATLGQPLLVGASRKRFLGNVTGAEVDQRLPGSLVAAAAATWGGAAIVRVHDVAATRQAVTLAARLDPAPWASRWETHP